MRTKEEVVNDFLERLIPEEQAIRAELEGIWEEGYNAGILYNEKKINEECTRQYNKGFANGHDAGKDEAYKELSGWTTEEGNAKWIEAYSSGKNLAWGMAQKLMAEPRKGGYGLSDMYDIFGTDKNESVLLDHSVDEVIGMIDAFHAKKKSAPTNRDKFEELFHEQFPRLWHSYQIAKNGYTSDNGFFIPDSWLDKPYKATLLDKPYEEPADGN